MRTDARRNHRSIVTAAIGVLAETPGASMQEIAGASGIGRTTLYRHFPDRGALVAAIHEEILADARLRTEERLARPEAFAAPVTAVADLAGELAGLGDEYRFLQHDLAGTSVPPEPAEDDVLRAFLEAGQQAGLLRVDLQADWLHEAVVALVTRGAQGLGPDAVVPREMVRASVRSLLTPPA